MNFLFYNPVSPGQRQGSARNHKDEAYRAISRWMTTLGWGRIKKSHELRKLAGSIWITKTGSLAAAAAMLGDSHSTTERYYAKILDEGMPAIDSFT